MKNSIFKSAAAAASLLALTLPQIASAQEAAEACVEQSDLSAGVIYSMPILVSAFQAKCGGELSATGFMATQGDAFANKYTVLQDSNWPGAMNLLMQFASRGKGGGEMASMFAALPEDALRPFVDAIILQKVGEEIKLKDCGKIERGVEMLAPLPPENMGGLITFIVDMAGVKNPSLCPYKPNEPVTND